MIINLKEEFYVVEPGTTYLLPIYTVEEDEGLVKDPDHTQELTFVRGSKLAEEDVTPRKGTLHEHLLAAQIYDLKHKNKLVPSHETAMAITKLEEALHWLRARQIDRVKRRVQGTYQE